MKKIIIVLAVATITFVGCNKDQDLSGYATTDQLNELRQQMGNKFFEFSVTFPSIENEYFSQTQYNGLKNKVKKEDALLVYASLFGAWAQLPYCQSNLSITYYRTDDGTLYFRYGLANYVQFSQEAQTMQMRAIAIPQTSLKSLKEKGVDLNSYEDVVNACEESQITYTQF